LFAAALRNVRAEAPENVDVMRVTNRCRIFFFRSEGDDNLSGRILGLLDLVTSVEPVLPAGARPLADLSSGALVGIPIYDLLDVCFFASGDLLTGSANVVQNVRENHDDEDPDRVSTWIYWVKGEHIEEMEYEMEGDEVASIDFPNELLPLLE